MGLNCCRWLKWRNKTCFFLQKMGGLELSLQRARNFHLPPPPRSKAELALERTRLLLLWQYSRVSMSEQILCMSRERDSNYDLWKICI